MLLQPIMASLPGGLQTDKEKKKKQKKKQGNKSKRYKKSKRICNYVLYNIHSSTNKSHNTVYTRTALLKAAELVSSFSSDGSRFHNRAA